MKREKDYYSGKNASFDKICKIMWHKSEGQWSGSWNQITNPSSRNNERRRGRERPKPRSATVVLTMKIIQNWVVNPANNRLVFGYVYFWQWSGLIGLHSLQFLGYWFLWHPCLQLLFPYFWLIGIVYLIFSKSRKQLEWSLAEKVQHPIITMCISTQGHVMYQSTIALCRFYYAPNLNKLRELCPNRDCGKP